MNATADWIHKWTAWRGSVIRAFKMSALSWSRKRFFTRDRREEACGWEILLIVLHRIWTPRMYNNGTHPLPSYALRDSPAKSPASSWTRGAGLSSWLRKRLSFFFLGGLKLSVIFCQKRGWQQADFVRFFFLCRELKFNHRLVSYLAHQDGLPRVWYQMNLTNLNHLKFFKSPYVREYCSIDHSFANIVARSLKRSRGRPR